MHRRVARHPLEPPRDAQQFLHLWIVLLEILERLALLQRLVERHVERRRNLLRHLVDVGERHLEDAPHIPHDRFRLHRTERDDLRDVCTTVLAGDVLDHFAAATLAEVDVDIRQRHAFGVEETLEDEIEINRIDVRDAHAVRHEASCRRPAPWPDWNALLACIADEIPDDQEVAGIAHLLDHLDFVRETTFVLVHRVAQCSSGGELLESQEALSEASTSDVLEVVVERKAVGNVEIREVVLAFLERHVAALGDAHAVLQGVREV